jgi:hypothetical protein
MEGALTQSVKKKKSAGCGPADQLREEPLTSGCPAMFVCRFRSCGNRRPTGTVFARTSHHTAIIPVVRANRLRYRLVISGVTIMRTSDLDRVSRCVLRAIEQIGDGLNVMELSASGTFSRAAFRRRACGGSIELLRNP